MSSGAVLLRDFPGDVVELRCTKCERHGRYSKASLIAEHGGEIGLPDLRAKLAADCPKMQTRVGGNPCSSYYPALSGNALGAMLAEHGAVDVTHEHAGGGIVITGASKPRT